MLLYLDEYLATRKCSHRNLTELSPHMLMSRFLKNIPLTSFSQILPIDNMTLNRSGPMILRNGEKGNEKGAD